MNDVSNPDPLKTPEARALLRSQLAHGLETAGFSLGAFDAKTTIHFERPLYPTLLLGVWIDFSGVANSRHAFAFAGLRHTLVESLKLQLAGIKRGALFNIEHGDVGRLATQEPRHYHPIRTASECRMAANRLTADILGPAVKSYAGIRDDNTLLDHLCPDPRRTGLQTAYAIPILLHVVGRCEEARKFISAIVALQHAGVLNQPLPSVFEPFATRFLSYCTSR